MIDTDKYEGHTPAPWDKLSEYCPVSSIDKQLIADAPLLLAEVERLREEVYNLTRANDTAWALSEVSEEEVKRLRKITDFVKSSIDFHYHSIDNNTGGFVNWMEFARELYLMLYGGEEE